MTVVSLPDAHLLEAAAGLPGVEAVLWDLTGSPPRDDIELLIPPYMSSPSRLRVLADLPKLRAVQTVTAGYDHVWPYLPEGIQLANGAGIHDASTAELALALTLASLRGIPEFVRAQESGEWLRSAGRRSLADRKVLILGYGSVGRAVAARMKPFEVDLTAVASRRRDGDELVDQVYGIDEVDTLLPDAEVVVIITPLTDRTRGLVDADFLARLPDGALVVNIARGPVVVTDALLAECAAGRLHAALDVTDPEPLPADHPLWQTPGVLISPHIGGASTAFTPRAQRFLRRQIEVFASGAGLENVVTQ